MEELLAKDFYGNPISQKQHISKQVENKPEKINKEETNVSLLQIASEIEKNIKSKHHELKSIVKDKTQSIFDHSSWYSIKVSWSVKTKVNISSMGTNFELFGMNLGGNSYQKVLNELMPCLVKAITKRDAIIDKLLELETI